MISPLRNTTISDRSDRGTFVGTLLRLLLWRHCHRLYGSTSSEANQPAREPNQPDPAPPSRYACAGGEVKQITQVSQASGKRRKTARGNGNALYAVCDIEWVTWRICASDAQAVWGKRT